MNDAVRKQLANCLLLLILSLQVLLPLHTVDGSSRFNHLRTESPSPSSLSNQVRFIGRSPHGSPTNGAAAPGGDLFDDDKRRVHTGPNPLHNR